MLTLTPFNKVFGNGLNHPFDVFGNVHQELERFFEGGPRGSFPALNLWSNTEEAVVAAELPGFGPEDVEVTVEDNQLVLKGERKGEESGDKYRRQERWSGRFERTLKLPFAVEAEGVKARFDKGVLEIKLPRREADKPRKITVKPS